LSNSVAHSVARGEVLLWFYDILLTASAAVPAFIQEGCQHAHTTSTASCRLAVATASLRTCGDSWQGIGTVALQFVASGILHQQSCQPCSTCPQLSRCACIAHIHTYTQTWSGVAGWQSAAYNSVDPRVPAVGPGCSVASCKGAGCFALTAWQGQAAAQD
jgi:hypothetical protein